MDCENPRGFGDLIYFPSEDESEGESEDSEEEIMDTEQLTRNFKQIENYIYSD